MSNPSLNLDRYARFTNDKIDMLEKRMRDLKEGQIALLRRKGRHDHPVALSRRIAGVVASFALCRDYDPAALARRLCGPNSPEANFVEKAVTNPAQTTIAGWAVELIGSGVYPGLYSAVAQQSGFAILAGRGLSVDMSGRKTMGLPGHLPATPLPDPFVGEGAPIPVRQFGVSGAMLTIFKAAVITTVTQELARASTPEAIPAFERMIAEDVGLAIDAALFSATAASAIRPAGLLNGVTPLAASTAASLSEACAADLAALAGAISPAADPVYVMSPVQAASLALLGNGAASALSIIATPGVAAKRMIAVDAGAFVSASNGGTFDVSTTATVHEDDAPLPIATGASGAGAVTAAPARSLWQTGGLGIRMIEDIGWAMRATGRVAHVDTVKW